MPEVAGRLWLVLDRFACMCICMLAWRLWRVSGRCGEDGSRRMGDAVRSRDCGGMQTEAGFLHSVAYELVHGAEDSLRANGSKGSNQGTSS